jgi:hypothetical protein
MDGDRQNTPEPNRGGRHRKGAVHLAAALLATGATTASVAERLDLGVRTLERWRRRPTFKALVETYRDRVIDEAVGFLASLLAKANAALADLLASENDKVKLAAAQTVWDMTRDRGRGADRKAGDAQEQQAPKVTEVVIGSHQEAVEFQQWKARMQEAGKW